MFFKKSKPLEKSSEICLYSLEIWNQHKICDFWTYTDQLKKKYLLWERTIGTFLTRKNEILNPKTENKETVFTILILGPTRYP